MKSFFEISSNAFGPLQREAFNRLLGEISENLESDLPEEEQLQNCFSSAMRNYESVKRHAIENGFADEEEGVVFFREVKPKFTCFIEFFVTAGEALRFANSETNDSLSFWKEEAEKYSRFCNRYSDFIGYYSGNWQYLDREYFMQSTADSITSMYSNMFDQAPFLYSSKDWLVRSFLANRMYHDFVKDKIIAIEQRKEQDGCRN